MFETVIFDMDGVLIDSEIVYYKWLQDFLQQGGYHVLDKELKRIVGMSAVQSEQLLNELYGDDQGTILWKGYLKESNSKSLNYNDILNPGVREILEFLKLCNVKIGLASSSNMDEILEVLEETNLIYYFSVILSGEMFHESKPNPEIYLEIMKELKTAPEKCIIIEDSYYGIEAGKKAGAYVIAKEETRFEFSQEKADEIVSDIYVAKNRIKSLLNR